MDDTSKQSPLFQNTDEQERIYSPDTVPGADDMPAQEVDADSPAHKRDTDGGIVAVPLVGGDVAGPQGGGGTRGPIIAPIVDDDAARDTDRD